MKQLDFTQEQITKILTEVASAVNRNRWVNIIGFYMFGHELAAANSTKLQKNESSE